LFCIYIINPILTVQCRKHFLDDNVNCLSINNWWVIQHIFKIKIICTYIYIYIYFFYCFVHHKGRYLIIGTLFTGKIIEQFLFINLTKQNIYIILYIFIYLLGEWVFSNEVSIGGLEIVIFLCTTRNSSQFKSLIVMFVVKI